MTASPILSRFERVVAAFGRTQHRSFDMTNLFFVLLVAASQPAGVVATQIAATTRTSLRNAHVMLQRLASLGLLTVRSVRKERGGRPYSVYSPTPQLFTLLVLEPTPTANTP